MNKVLLVAIFISLSVNATCWQSPETVCFSDKELDLKMTYSRVSCSPPGGPVNHSSTMQISSLSQPNKVLNIKPPKYLRNIIQQKELKGIIDLKSENELNSLLIIQKDINDFYITLVSDLYPELNTKVKTKLKSYKCEHVKLMWGMKGARVIGPPIRRH
jgi:hypothetical protein